MSRSIRKIKTICVYFIFLIVLSVDSTVNAIEVSDPCGDTGGRGNDIKKVTASSDGTNIILTVELCEQAEATTKYLIRIDHKDPNDLDNDLETNEPDTLINNNQDCLKTFEVTKTYWIYQPIEEDTCPGIIELSANILTYTVSYAGLGLSPGNKILIWLETTYLGIHERVPNTDSTDGCSISERPEEVILLTLKANETACCEDPDTNLQWERLIQELPDDMQVHTLHALKLGLSLKVERGDLTASQASELFDKIRNTLMKENTEDMEKQ